MIERKFRSGGGAYCVHLRDSLCWQHVSLNCQNLQTIKHNLSLENKIIRVHYGNEQNDWVLNQSTTNLRPSDKEFRQGINIINQQCKNNIHKDVVLVRYICSKIQHKPKELSSKLKLNLQLVTQILLTTKLKMYHLFRSDELLLHQSTVELNAVLFRTSNVLKQSRQYARMEEYKA